MSSKYSSNLSERGLAALVQSVFPSLSLSQPLLSTNTYRSSASADRRPVDPPPVVELKILEGESKIDVTFSHNANFFLYTTLESARTILPGRNASAQSLSPVLTGMPVAGMAYLDRPSPAGYFIFPDLSVRHEGKYRLLFNLYEEYKGNLIDVSTAPSNSDRARNKHPPALQVPQSNHFHFRLEVKSEPFTVYSAKKFPGLAESTSLSRLVAEQGCRVRIRRDVRMRRRDTKPSKEHDDLEEETLPYNRADRYCTPDNFGSSATAERARSVSATSVDPNNMYQIPERRTSVHDVSYYNQQPYQQPSVAPVLQTTSANFNTHLNFGNASNAPQPQVHALPSNGPAPVQSSVPYSPNPTGYQSHQGLSHSRQISSGSDYAYHPQAYPQSQYGVQTYTDTAEYKPPLPYARPAGPQPSSSTRDAHIYPAVDSRLVTGNQANYVQSPIIADPRSSTPTGVQHLPPLKALQPASERKYEHSTASGVGGDSGAVASQAAYDTNNDYSTYSSSNQVANGSMSRLGKRAYEKVFDTDHISQPVHGGARPEAAGQDVPQVECDGGYTDEVDLTSKMLSYRRADGSRQHKKIPSPIF